MQPLNNLIGGKNAIPIAGITSDSRQVRRGFLFAALPGSKVAGVDYIADAIHNGAAAILAPKGTKLPDDANDVTLIEDTNPRKTLALAAAKFYGQQPQTIFAVTGTNGKTSTVTFCQQLWHLSGHTKCASLGTLGVRGPGMIRSGSMTTPDPVSLHAELADLAAAGISRLAMEASSHGLSQYRLDGVQLAGAAFTNLTPEHLDYHQDMGSYFQAKARLFTDILPEGARAVLSADDDYFEKLKAICKARNIKVISYGHAGEDILLKNITPKPHGQEIEIIVGGEEYILTLPLVGDFQVLNALCALALTEAAPKLLEKLRGVPGRLQLVEGFSKGAVYIDYAHTSDALLKALKAIRPHTQNKLICVFGCGGDRDRSKRPAMGAVATEHADMVIVTDDNPRTEEPASIRAAILEMAPGAMEIGDRALAIQTAIQNMEEGDVVLIAGKGHETGQDINGVIKPFNDYEEAKKYLSERVSAA